MLHRFLRGEEQPKDIHVEVFVELFLGDLFNWRPVVNSRVVNQDVDLAEGLFSLSKEMFDVCLPGHICPNGNGLCRRAWQFDPLLGRLLLYWKHS